MFHKGRTGVAISYEDAVCEALCFGWIDSLIRRLDDDRYARKFTPRRASSRWSEGNRRRWAELDAAGLLAAPGRAAAPTGRRYAPRPVVPELPAYIARRFNADRRVWRQFQTLTSTDRRRFIVWIHVARRRETRERRLRASLALLAAGRTLGLK